mmetsp:Transcript_104764/g.312970  ORF Transcript_104764/g.312970 Transcript_104764/m.312970 type:complete len:279 (+) Transcript_104764:388-1224(+)
MNLLLLGAGTQEGDTADQLHQVHDVVAVAVEEVPDGALDGLRRRLHAVRLQQGLVRLEELLARELPVLRTRFQRGQAVNNRHGLEAAGPSQLLEALQLRVVVLVLGLVGALRVGGALHRNWSRRRGAGDRRLPHSSHDLWGDLLAADDGARAHGCRKWTRGNRRPRKRDLPHRRGQRGRAGCGVRSGGRRSRGTFHNHGACGRGVGRSGGRCRLAADHPRHGRCRGGLVLDAGGEDYGGGLRLDGLRGGHRWPGHQPADRRNPHRTRLHRCHCLRAAC